METCFNYIYGYKAYFSSDERKWINKMRKLAEERPDDVVILKQPEENDGCIYCMLPSAWLKIRPNQVLSDEKRAELADRARTVFRA